MRDSYIGLSEYQQRKSAIQSERVRLAAVAAQLQESGLKAMSTGDTNSANLLLAQSRATASQIGYLPLP